MRFRTAATLALTAAVVVALVLAATTWWRSPGQRLERAANDLSSAPGVERSAVDDSPPSRASGAASVSDTDRVSIQLRPQATRQQVASLIRRAAKQTIGAADYRIFYLETGRATTCVCDDSTDQADTVAAQVLALRDLSSGQAYVYDDTSVGLDPPDDETGGRSLAQAQQALRLLQDAGLAMPVRFRTYNGRIELDATDDAGTAGQMGQVLGASRSLLSADWRVSWLSGGRLSFDIPPGVTLTRAQADVRTVAGLLGHIRQHGAPVVRRVVASSADKSAYADVTVPGA